MTTQVYAIILILISLAFLQTINCNIITLDQGHEECYYERLQKGNKVKFIFEVLDGGSLDIELTIKDPNNYVIHTEQGQSSGRYTIEANQDGPHTYCFGNKLSSPGTKIIMYTIEINENNKNSDVEHDRLQNMVTELIALVTGVKHEMDFLSARDRLHWSISERINNNLNVWSIVEFVITLSFAIGQTFYIKRFFEVRRSI